MYNQDAINMLLRESTQSKLENALRTELKRFLRASSDRMSNLWTDWDNLSWIYRGYRLPDRQDREDVSKKQPPKIIVPISYAQIQTALAFSFATFNQKPNFYEIQGRGANSDVVANGMEIDLNWQAVNNKMLFKSYLWMLDALKMGFGVVKNQWVAENEKRRVQRQVPAGPFGGAFKALGFKTKMKVEELVVEIPSYEGNRITNISPYCFFPDPDFSIHEWWKGSFVAHEEEVSMGTVRYQEGRLYHGTDKITTSYSDAEWNYRPRRSTLIKDNFTKTLIGKEMEICILSECIFSVSPRTLRERHKIDDVDIGDEDYPVKFIVTMANDQKIIRFERYNYLHDQYGYSVIEYSPDFNSWYNPGIAQTINPLQDFMTWLLNSHMGACKKMLRNQLLIDEKLVNRDDIDQSMPYIRCKSGANANLDAIVKQLQIYDQTGKHIDDIQSIYKIIQVVTGINDNASGQYNTGRRSAAEVRGVNAGAATRMKMNAQLMWFQGFEPLARQMIANTRQSRTKAFYNRIVGDLVDLYPFEQVILSDPEQIAGEFDVIPYDATLPSDKQAQSQVLMEAFTLLMQNPAAAATFNKNPVLLLQHIMELNGIKYWREFDLNKAPLNPLAGAQTAAATDPSILVGSPGQIDQARNQGAQQVDVGGEDVLRSLVSGGMMGMTSADQVPGVSQSI